MTKFVLLFSGGGMPETEEEQAAVMAAWGRWYEGMGAGVVDPGNPLGFTPKTISSDGTVSEGVPGVQATGYTIINAASHGAAVEMAKGCPIRVRSKFV